MEQTLDQKIKELTKERDLAKSVLPPFYQFHVEKAYRDSIVKMFNEDTKTLNNKERQGSVIDLRYTPLWHWLIIGGASIFIWILIEVLQS